MTKHSLNRRGFLGLLGIGAASLAIDHEKLLWTPEKKTIFIPPVSVISPNFSYNQLLATTLENWAKDIEEQVNSSLILYYRGNQWGMESDTVTVPLVYS